VELHKLTLVTDPAHPLYDERIHYPVNERWARRFAKRGCRSILKVRKDGEALLIVDGRQRYNTITAANKLREAEGLEPLLVQVELERGDMADLSLLGEELNAFRVGDDAMTRARKMQRQLDMGVAPDEVAEAFDLTPDGLKFNLRLLDLSPRVQAAVQKGRVGPTEAVREFGKLDAAAQDDKLDVTPDREVKGGKAKRRTGKAKPERKRPGAVFLRRAAEEGKLPRCCAHSLMWACGAAEPKGKLAAAVTALRGGKP
jgi:ParB family chromosome partitioning protein